MRVQTFVLLILCVAVSAAPAAAENNPLAWPRHRHAAAILSDVAVTAQIGLDTIHSLRAPDRRDSLLKQGLRLGLTIGAAELTKRLVHRTRPDGTDDLSFFSEHTAIAAASGGWRLSVSIPLTGVTGYGRMAANRHYFTDTLAGAAVGATIGRALR